MKIFKKLFVCVFILALVTSCSSESGSTSSKKVDHLKWITFTQKELEQSKKNLEIEGHVAHKSYEKLIRDAEKSMEAGPYSVMYKSLTADSGDKRDYLSMSPYWWPNPDTADGLPYVRRDGETNPEVRGNGTDKYALELMTLDVYNLGIAYYFTGDEKYAEKAAELTRVWFLDEETYMNPNAKFAQGVLGLTPGRSYGLIETRHFLKVIDGMLLVQHKGSPAWSEKEMNALRDWFTQFVDWMYESPLGFIENNAYNNHGVWYNAQLVGFLLFTGQFEKAQEELRNAMRRETSHFASNGHQPWESTRTRSYHYHCFALAAWAHLIRYGQLTDYPIHYKNPMVVASRNVRSGVRYMLPFVIKEKEWAYRELDVPEFIKAMQFLPLLRDAYLPENLALYTTEYNDPYTAAVSVEKSTLPIEGLNSATEMLFDEFPTEKEVLLFPVLK